MYICTYIYCKTNLYIKLIKLIYIYIYIYIQVNQVKKTKLFFKIPIIFRHVVFLKFFFILQNLKIFLQIQCTINLGIEQITSIRWLTIKWYRKLIDLIIYVHIVNLLQLTVQA